MSHALVAAGAGTVRALIALACLACWPCTVAHAQALPDAITAKTKISGTFGNLPAAIGPGSEFGTAVTWLGDVDGDLYGDVAVGVPLEEEVWVLYLTAEGQVKDSLRIGVGSGGLAGDPGPFFGFAVAALGDLDGNGTEDLAVGNGDSGIWILFFGADGMLNGQNILIAGIAASGFGRSLAVIGDLDGDGVTELLGGAPLDDDGGASASANRGAAYVLFLNADGTEKSRTKISDTEGGFTGVLDDNDFFGTAVAALGDLDGDGTVEVAVGAPLDDDGSAVTFGNKGAVWILSLNADGTVAQHTKISATSGTFGGTLKTGDTFGWALSTLPDMDGDGLPELGVGAPLDDDGASFIGEVDLGSFWVLSLLPDGSVDAYHEFIAGPTGVGGVNGEDRLGTSLVPFSVPDGGPCNGLLVGAPGEDDGGEDIGALWVLFLDAGTWTTLGGGLAGTFGIPTVSHEGVLCQGNPLSLTLHSGQVASVGFMLVIGFSELDAPFKGGTLVPFPHLLTFAATEPSGSITLTGQWPPAVPSGFQTTFQFWVHDPGPPGSLSASNALRAAAP